MSSQELGGTGLVMIVWAAVVVVLYVAIVVRNLRRRTRRRPLGRGKSAVIEEAHAFSSQASRLRGGAWFEGSSISWPGAELVVDDTHICVRSRLPILSADVCVSRKDVVQLSIRRGFLGVGLRIETTTGVADETVFWALTRRSLRRTLIEAGWDGLSGERGLRGWTLRTRAGRWTSTGR